MSVIILDLDNTIADDSWRIPHINWQKSDPTERYHAYHTLSAFDAAGNRDLFEGSPHDIVIFTARPVLYHAMTVEWLRRNNVVARHIMMRNNGDHRPSRALKMTQLHWLLELYDIKKSDIVHAYDDREDVVQDYAALGLVASVRQIHKLCAYTAPENA